MLYYSCFFGKREIVVYVILFLFVGKREIVVYVILLLFLVNVRSLYML